MVDRTDFLGDRTLGLQFLRRPVGQENLKTEIRKNPRHRTDLVGLTERPGLLWGLRTTPNRSTGYTPFFMVYDAEAVLPCDIIHDSPEGTCTKRERPSLIGKTA